MPSQFHQDESPVAVRVESVNDVEPLDAAGERLDAALAADQAERERLAQAWESRYDRWLAAAGWCERARKLLFWPGACTFFVGAGLVLLFNAVGLVEALPPIVARCVFWATVLGLAATVLALLIEPFESLFTWIAALTLRAAAHAGIEIFPRSRERGKTL